MCLKLSLIGESCDNPRLYATGKSLWMINDLGGGEEKLKSKRFFKGFPGSRL
jgi:hypothetical protein